jgi:hypothetical protein
MRALHENSVAHAHEKPIAPGISIDRRAEVAPDIIADVMNRGLLAFAGTTRSSV